MGTILQGTTKWFSSISLSLACKYVVCVKSALLSSFEIKTFPCRLTCLTDKMQKKTSIDRFQNLFELFVLGLIVNPQNAYNNMHFSSTKIG